MSLTEGFKALASSIKKYKDPELIAQVVSLQNEVWELQNRVSELGDENQRLKDSLVTKKSLVRHEDAYYTADESGKPTGKPFCSRCRDVDHQAIYLISWADGHELNICPACKSVYEEWLTQEIKTE